MGLSIFLLSAATLVGGVDAPAPSIEELVNRNVETLSRVKSVAMQMHHTVRYYQNGKENKPPLVNSWIWATSDGKERLRFGDPLSLDDEGHPKELHDVYIENKSIHRLSNWDPDHPFAINPAKTRVRGMVDVYTGAALVPNAQRMLGWSFSLPNGGEMRRTLLELAHASPEAEFLGSATVDGHRCWQVRFAHPGLPADPLNGTYFQVLLDPAVGYLPRRVIEHWKLSPSADAGTEPPSQETEITFKSYTHPASDVWIPTEIETHIGFSPDDGFHETIVTTVRDILVNDERVEEKLAFAYPENCLVTFPTTDPDRMKMVLWGKNNQPGKEIRSYEDIPGIEPLTGAAEAAAPIEQPVAARGFPWLIVVNASALAMIVIAVALRRLRK